MTNKIKLGDHITVDINEERSIITNSKGKEVIEIESDVTKGKSGEWDLKNGIYAKKVI